MLRKRVVISAGGTGGHLFPAQAAAEALDEHAEVLFLAADLKSSRYFDRSRFCFKEVPASTFSFKHPLHLMKGIWKNGSGFFKARHYLKKFKPSIVIGFGSFYTLPVAVAALSLRIPLVLHEQNAIPGKVNRLLSKYSLLTAITFPSSTSFLNGKWELVQFPLRKKKESDQSPWEYFHLTEGVTTILVFGGSQGAQKLNNLFLEAVFQLDLPCQILHFTGNLASAEQIKKSYSDKGIAACVKSFETRMDLAWKIADVAVTRAGAGTISELIESETPALLIPYPFATDNHQEKNGEFFTKEVGGGIQFKENELDPKLFANSLKDLIRELPIKKVNICSFKNTKPRKSLAEVILEKL